MRNPAPCALLLLLVALALTQYCAGSHWLQTFNIMILEYGIWEPRFIQVGYVDSIQFQGFDSKGGTARMQPRAAWMGQEPPEYWEKETEEALLLSERDRQLLRIMVDYYGHWKNDYHTLQEVFGCNVANDGRFLRGHYRLAYYGYDYIILNENLSSWTAEGKAVKNLLNSWEAEAERWRTYLQEDCMERLLRCLDLGKETLLRSEAPQTLVTHRVRPEGNVTLRCWALGFYPADITLIWQRDGNNHTQDMELPDTRPAGDGTFQKWAAVVVPSGEELRYTCHVHHEGLPEPLTLKWEPPAPRIPIMEILIGLVLGTLVVGTVVIFLVWKK
ncbi:HLA class I histocompatibility antigen, A-25 alpha chain-like isoform X2 [Grammomys surdaster]|uniref:HLA class I histocompatibility antigen, A-25 alpha chain-like isoform X2 n=1 Tax=Grammomys surdaster TaxID=491861 RepID=UPI00109EE475|nr:HLA class I histocompatibility antigen, A-25 alpha chain-like isoform X2 [Grammomys surdaster]